MKNQEVRYPTEDRLVKEFCSVLESDDSPWGQVKLTTEFFYIRGRTDVVAVDPDGDVLAFELKLDRWRQALHQAYKNTSFAHRSYVVLPESASRRAQRYPHEFARRSVGLCYVKDKDVVVVLPATHQIPIQPWLSRAATFAVEREN